MFKTALTLRLLILFLLIFTSNLFAAPSKEEQRNFFSQKRQEAFEFEKSLLLQTSSQNAAAREFAENERSERIAFSKTLAGLTAQDKQRLAVEFNELARQKRKKFEQNLLKLSKSPLEKKLEDHDKETAALLKGALNQPVDANPRIQTESLRQFRNRRALERARIKNNFLTDLAVKKRNYYADKVQATKNFLSEAG